MTPPPEYLCQKCVLEKYFDSKNFNEIIREYNNALAFASMGMRKMAILKLVFNIKYPEVRALPGNLFIFNY